MDLIKSEIMIGIVFQNNYCEHWPGRLYNSRIGGGGGGPMAKNGEKWRKMAKNGDGEFAFFICQIRHFSPIFDFGISLLTDF